MEPRRHTVPSAPRTLLLNPGPSILAAVLAAAAAAPPAAKHFLADDPVRVDPDRLPIAKPAPVELSNVYDVLENTFRHRPGGADAPRAVNVNTLGEVPDSSWFTNRIGVRGMTTAEIARGARAAGPPDVSGALTVIAAKSGGITPGFTLRDPRGHVYFVKFDPAAQPNLSTAADVIGSRFFHAFGYHVPQNDVAYVRRDQLRIDPKATVKVAGHRRPMTDADLDRNLASAARLPDGRIRIVASLRLEGEPLGPFRYHGTRADDANDVFPHQDRRELRGLRVFSAWLNHDDSRAINTQDMFVAGESGGSVRHHLIDFSSSLGSGSDARREIAPQNPRAGNEYVLELGPMLRSLFTLGLWDRPWRTVRYPEHPGVGNFEAEFFTPDAWRPEYPNPAFERMQEDDAFWAAAIVHEFTDDLVRAAVATGELGDPESERYLADTLIRRRDKVVAHYFARANPLSGFVADGAGLRFRNLGEEAGLARADGYGVEWSEFDNATGAHVASGTVDAAGLPIEIPDRAGPYLAARIRTRTARRPEWARPVIVYLRRSASWEVVGIERAP